MESRTKNSKKKKTASVLLTLAYVGVHVFLALHHEAWRDEGQSWMLVKNSSVPELLSLLCIEGHPALWFFTIMPFVRLGMSFRYFYSISLVFMGLSYYFVLQKAPFPYWARILITFSNVFWYYNPVIPRIYSEICFLLVLIAVCFPSREERPWLYAVLLFLLGQSHVLMAGVAASLVFERFMALLRKKTRNNAFIPFVGGLVSGLLSLVELYPRAGTKRSVDVSVGGIVNHFSAERFQSCVNAFIRNLWGTTSQRIERFIIVSFAFCVVIVIIGLIIQKEGKLSAFIECFMIALSVGMPMFIVLVVYPVGHEQMASCFLMIVLFLVCICWGSEHTVWYKRLVFIVALLISITSMPHVLKEMLYDLQGAYSNSKGISEYIVESVDENAVIFVENSEYNSPVYSYVVSSRDDILFYSLTDMEEYKYHVWGKGYVPSTGAEAAAVKVNVFSDRSVYFLRTEPLEDDGYLSMVAWENEDTPSGERYFLYHLGA